MDDIKQKREANISVIIPIYNEEGNLEELYKRLITVFKQQLNLNYEIIFIDDGSTDRSWEHIKVISDSDDNVRGIKFSKNFGQSIALSAGIDYAFGDVVIMMDGDLQHPPELIPKLVQKWKEGYDIVYTIREENKDCRWLKRSASRLFCWLMNKLSKINLPKGAADFRLLSRPVIQNLKNFKERARFMRGIISWIGYRQIGISYIAESRRSGFSNYSFLRLLRLAINSITSFSSIPLYVSTFLGIFIASVSFIYAAYAVYIKLFTNRFVPGWASILISVLFIGGTQLIAIGILGEYLAKIYDEVKQRPLYIVEETKGISLK